GITSLNRSGFDAIILYHFDAAELAPSTASKADICGAKSHVRFAPNSDIDCVFRHVRFGPKADSCTAALRTLFDHLVSSREQGRGHREPKRALAALRLMTSSNLVGNSTGRSPGFSPFNMRAT